MANDLGGAVNMLKQLLADDKMKDTLTGLLGGIMGGENSNDDDVVPLVDEDINENFDQEDNEIAVDEPHATSLPMAGGTADNALQTLLSTVDIQSLYGSLVGAEDKRVILLNALRPYLNRKRQGKIDSAITIMQLVSISSSLGLDKLFGR